MRMAEQATECAALVGDTEGLAFGQQARHRSVDGGFQVAAEITRGPAGK